MALSYSASISVQVNHIFTSDKRWQFLPLITLQASQSCSTSSRCCGLISDIAGRWSLHVHRMSTCKGRCRGIDQSSRSSHVPCPSVHVSTINFCPRTRKQSHKQLQEVHSFLASLAQLTSRAKRERLHIPAGKASYRIVHARHHLWQAAVQPRGRS